MTISWQNDYSVGVVLIDEQHKHFVDLLNKLTDAFYKGEGVELLEEIFKELFDYAGYHFATEEKYFIEFNYEGTLSHVAEHQRFVTELTKMYEESKKDNLKTTVQLVDFMEDWLVHHVQTVDKLYTKCFNEHGLK